MDNSKVYGCTENKTLNKFKYFFITKDKKEI
jgi:hypothetical protein